MKYADYAPAANPSVEQQFDALAKGLGRAYWWAIAGKLVDEPLFDAALHDRRFDGECEDSRGDWLWRILQGAGAVERFRPSLLEALQSLDEASPATQLCELARNFAEQHDMIFLFELYDVVRRKPIAECGYFGEREIVSLDGERGFLFAARRRGEQPSDEWEWHADALISDATQRLGAERVESLLATATDAGTRAFYAAWTAERDRRRAAPPAEPYVESLTRTTVEQVLEAARSPHPMVSLRGWGMHADEGALSRVAEHVLSVAGDPIVLKNLLRVFSNRPIPNFDPKWLDRDRGQPWQ